MDKNCFQGKQIIEGKKIDLGKFSRKKSRFHFVEPDLETPTTTSREPPSSELDLNASEASHITETTLHRITKH